MPTKQGISTMKAFMKNENIAKLIREATESPIGSTSRKRVQKLVGILQRMERQDGKGGGIPFNNLGKAPSISQMNMMGNQRRDPLMIFAAPPKPNFSPDGKGGGSTPHYGFLGTTLPNVLKATGETAAAGWGAGLIGGAEWAGRNLWSGAQGAGKALFGDAIPGQSSGYNRFTDTYGARMGINMLQQSDQKYGTKHFPGSGSTPQVGATSPLGFSFQGPTPSPSNPNLFLGSQTNKLLNEGLTTQGSWGGETPTQPQTSPDPWSIDYTPQSSGLYGDFVDQTGMNDYMKNPYANIGNETLRNALNQHMSATSFAYHMMNNPDELRKLPGFESVPDDALPYGASLSGQIGALAEVLRKETGIDAMMAEYMKKIQKGTTVQEDLKDYIRGRDEFLNETQGLIDDFKGKMVKMDLANPVIAQRAKQYNDYLYTLKGRQNKRYIEFLNASVTQFGHEMEAQRHGLELQLEDFERKLEFQGKLAIDEYNRYFTALTDLYTSAQGLPELELQRGQAQMEIISTLAEAIEDSVESTSKVTENYQKVFNWLVEKAMVSPDTKLPLASARDYAFIISQFGEGGQGVSADDIKAIDHAFTVLMERNFAHVVEEGNARTLMTHYDEYMAGIDRYYYQMLQLLGPESREYIALHAQRLKQQAHGTAFSGLSQLFSSEGEAAKLREAIKMLTESKEGTVFKKAVIPARNDFVNKYADSIDSRLLGMIWDSANEIAERDGADKLWTFWADSSQYLDQKPPKLENLSNQELVKKVLEAIRFKGYNYQS